MVAAAVQQLALAASSAMLRRRVQVRLAAADGDWAAARRQSNREPREQYSAGRGALWERRAQGWSTEAAKQPGVRAGCWQGLTPYNKGAGRGTAETSGACGACCFWV